jgi:tetratricopeptide (TPR) repeat protein
MGLTSEWRDTRFVSDSSLEEAAESKPGHEPGIESRAAVGPGGGAARAIAPVGFCAALSGLFNLYHPYPGLTPGATLSRPFGPASFPEWASRRKLTGFLLGRLALIAAVAWLALAGAAAPIYAQRGQSSRGNSTAEAELQKGIELTRGAKFQEAIPHFLAAQGQVANASALSFNLALCYVGTGQYKSAIALLNELRSSGGNNANVENLLSQSLLGNGQPEEAFAAFERASRLAPENEKLYLFIVESCMNAGYYDMGLKVVEMGLKRLPRSAPLVFEHGILLARLDFIDEAMQELQKVTKLAPGSDVAYIAAAQKSIFESNVDEAVRIAREGIGKGKRHFMLLALYGEAVMLSGVEVRSPEFSEARAALEQSIALSPTYASARMTLGKLYLMESRMDDAIVQLNVARELDPKNSAVYSNLAAAYRRRGDTARAEEMIAILDKLNKEEIERIRNAPGDRKAGYMSKPVTKKK